MQAGLSAGDVAGHTVLDAKRLDDRLGLFAALLLDAGQVAHPQAFELPHGLRADVVAQPPQVQDATVAEALDAHFDQFVGRLEAVEHRAGHQDPPLFAANAFGDGPSKRLLRGQLGAVEQADRNQVVEWAARLDQRDLKMVVFGRHDHHRRVEPQELGQRRHRRRPRPSSPKALSPKHRQSFKTQGTLITTTRRSPHCIRAARSWAKRRVWSRICHQ